MNNIVAVSSSRHMHIPQVARRCLSARPWQGHNRFRCHTALRHNINMISAERGGITTTRGEGEEEEGQRVEGLEVSRDGEGDERGVGCTTVCYSYLSHGPLQQPTEGQGVDDGEADQPDVDGVS